ncbi:MAG: hypothetical protein JNL97_05375, partial [Verrucomicrobiales bacterium]|nr:hypothetical protein [Verrucomicrobiales bacterium]
RARRTLQEAIDAIAPLLPAMPKPVEVPPRVLAIPSKDVAAEAVLVAGLGMQPARVADPRVAVVFGRGRRVDEPLEGALITRTVLQDRLAIIGQDCECDLDRSSLQGPVIPARWDTSRQEAAARALGFDPENPLIRAEISRIVLKGPAKPGAKRNVSGAFDALALGYSEEPIDAPTTATSSAASSAAVAELPPAPGTREPEAPAIPSPSATPSGSRSRPETEPAPPSATARALGLWLALSGSGLVVATCGAWLLFRARKNRL